jgi:hypothetical protein
MLTSAKPLWEILYKSLHTRFYCSLLPTKTFQSSADIKKAALTTLVLHNLSQLLALSPWLLKKRLSQVITAASTLK